MRRFATIRAVLALMGLAIALAIAPALPALAQTAPTGTVHIGQTATLVAKGAAIRLPIRYSCSSDVTFASLSVSITQRVGGHNLAKGFAYTEDLVCDGARHTVVLTVAAVDNPFRRGAAFAEARLVFCNPDTCRSVTTSREITIVRR